MSANLAVQKAIRAVLVASPALLTLVPAASILDRNARPNPSPSIILGETDEVDGGLMNGASVRIVHTIHLWKKEPSLAGVRWIGYEIRRAIRNGRVSLERGYFLAGWLTTARYIRDPDGETSHGIITLTAIVTGGDL
jgi:hypothetical protein